MSKSVAIIRARDRFPARRYLLLAVISIVVLGAPAADARSKAKPAPVHAPAAVVPVVPAKATLATATSASLRGTNDSVTSKPIVEAPPIGSILGGVTVGKAPTATAADVVVEPAPSASPQRTKDWYPESHSYLRPYHYKWRYWTPG